MSDKKQRLTDQARRPVLLCIEHKILLFCSFFVRERDILHEL